MKKTKTNPNNYIVKVNGREGKAPTFSGAVYKAAGKFPHTASHHDGHWYVLYPEGASAKVEILQRPADHHAS